MLWRKHGISIILGVTTLSTLLSLVWVSQDSSNTDFQETLTRLEGRQKLLTDSISNMTAQVSALLKELADAEGHHEESRQVSKQSSQATEQFEAAEAERIRTEATKKIAELQQYVDTTKKAIIGMIKKGDKGQE